ncbi:MAG: alpha-glucan family phosphorylase [Thiomargarita sp.]|nr:alpha-glucan family phosphorylase [Thiomargarita sp.]
MSAQEFNLEVIPILPDALKRLEELANDLRYSWHTPTRMIFERLDSKLWIKVGHNPKLFLRNIDQNRLEQATTDESFIDAYKQVLANYDNYCQDKEQPNAGKQLADDALIAYFCAEYGFHESLPIYSGGLGILAGDHCKTASDMRLPFIGVGLFYHKGYFNQQIDSEGNQISTYTINDPEYLPIKPLKNEAGEDIYVEVKIAETQIWIKAWEVKLGHITLYLLDTNVARNNEDDRAITHQLYGGDKHTRIRQEIVLGIGGVRLLRKIGLDPTIWHINEGHAAFLILERIREFIQAGQSFEAATEIVAANTVFTTHTPVPAGHDHFPKDLVMNYLGSYCHHELKLPEHDFLSLGYIPNCDNHDFNMTNLAIHGARHINGVSRIHGQISSEICGYFWPEITPDENPIGYVTNGVHVPSMLAREWSEVFDEKLGAEWIHHQFDTKFWEQGVAKIPDKLFWKIRQTIKARMLKVVRTTLTAQHVRSQISETHLERLLKNVDPDNPDILTIGFARRFATYKRATLLFKDMDKLRAIVNDINKPVVFIFAGKAHPADNPGQDLLKEIYKICCEPDFMGKILVVQGYDLGLSRRLVSGVDIWLNTPIYPLEASGTSGMKAGINGGLNLSVLDGWWPESYDGRNGWGIKQSLNKDENSRDFEDARSLYEVLLDEVIPSYYDRNEEGFSKTWVESSKHSMATILARFNTMRMLDDYVNNLYLPADHRGKQIKQNNYARAQELANWKNLIRSKWSGFQIRLLSQPQQEKPFSYGEPITIQVAVQLNGLNPQDIVIELLLSHKIHHPEILLPTRQDLQNIWEHDEKMVSYKFVSEHQLHDSNEHLYSLTFQPDLSGDLSYRIRVFPFHELLSNGHEMGMMRWL